VVAAGGGVVVALVVGGGAGVVGLGAGAGAVVPLVGMGAGLLDGFTDGLLRGAIGLHSSVKLPVGSDAEAAVSGLH
jgi:hypothetical protein